MRVGAELVRNAKALDEECCKWTAAKLRRRKVGKLTAQVLGLGANARKMCLSANGQARREACSAVHFVEIIYTSVHACIDSIRSTCSSSAS